MAKEEDVLAAIKLFEDSRPERSFDSIAKVKMGIWAALIFVSEANHQVTSKEISDYMDVSSARMTVLLKKMEAEGLIEKETSTKDGRNISVQLTSFGREKAEIFQNKRYTCLEQVVELYTLEELAELFQKLETIRDIMHSGLSGLEL